MREQQVVAILENHPALTGKELRDLSHLDELTLWRTCRLSERIELRIAGRRFLRLDRAVDGLARLTPSIKREFLTYTVCGLAENRKRILERAGNLEAETVGISRDKHALAKKIMSDILQSDPRRDFLAEGLCFILSGDIVFDMAHLEPRPEVSTGKLVRGSDLDIIVVADDGFPHELLEALDRAIHTAKYRYLIDPAHREEIDFIVKTLEKTRAQLRFDSFESKVASKILHDGVRLLGSPDLFRRIKTLLGEAGITEKLAALESRAVRFRREAEARLLKGEGDLSREEAYKLFFTREESDEIF